MGFDPGTGGPDRAGAYCQQGDLYEVSGPLRGERVAKKKAAATKRRAGNEDGVYEGKAAPE